MLKSNRFRFEPRLNINNQKSNMKTTRLFQAQLAAALLLSILNSQHSTARAHGSLTPPGAPAPTMKTLAQVEPRTPISSAPLTISVSGSYYLTTNLTVTGNAITIATNGVTLDLNGFTIASTAPSAQGVAIGINVGVSDLTIFNGHIRGGVTNNGGVYNGPGFNIGIYAIDNVNIRVTGVSVAGCLLYGIYLGAGNSSVVEACTVRTVGSVGMMASTIKNSVALDCGSAAIVGSQVSDSRGQATGSGTGIDATTAQNCSGTSGSSYGLYASTAQNCYGQSNSGTGLFANNTAQNCYGRSGGSSSGLYAYTAQNCYGQSSAGTGLSATMANSCYGISSSGTGLNAAYGNFCFGSSVSVANKYNMP